MQLPPEPHVLFTVVLVVLPLKDSNQENNFTHTDDYCVWWMLCRQSEVTRRFTTVSNSEAYCWRPGCCTQPAEMTKSHWGSELDPDVLVPAQMFLSCLTSLASSVKYEEKHDYICRIDPEIVVILMDVTARFIKGAEIKVNGNRNVTTRSPSPLSSGHQSQSASPHQLTYRDDTRSTPHLFSFPFSPPLADSWS